MVRCLARRARFATRVLGPLIFLAAVHGATAEETGAGRMQQLEKRVEALEAELARLKAELAQMRQESVATSQPDILAAEQTSTLQTSGFLHVFGDPLHLDVRPFTLGSFEYDVTAALSETVSTSGALVFTQDQTALGVGFVDVHLGAKGVGPRGRIFGEPGFHLQLGRFDIPFGLDYRFFAAPDRPGVAAPLVTQTLFGGGLNREGIRIHSTGKHIQYTFYGTRSLAADLGFSWGGRIGFTPTRNVYTLHRRAKRDLTVGVSWVINYGRDWTWIGSFMGVDAELRTPAVVLTGEWARRIDLGERLASFYANGTVRVGEPLGFPAAIFIRYDRGESLQELITVGLNVRFAEKALFKAEAGRYWSFGRIDPASEDLHRNNVNVQVVLIF